MPYINQFSPYSCVLDCWADFLRSIGYPVTTQELLTHHRDLCWHNPPDHHTYGSMGNDRFVVLASRYLFSAQEIISPTTNEIETIISQPRSAVFASSLNHANQLQLNHMCRVVGVQGSKLDLFSPAIPYGESVLAEFGEMVNDWKTTFIKVAF